MKKNGFTFIEILGVITLLALMSIIVLMVVDKSLKNSKSTLSDVQIENIKSAASMWRTDNIEYIPESGYYILSLGDLINNGYINDVIDPNSQSNYDSSILVGVGNSNIIVGKEADDYVSTLYGCNNTTVFCIKDRSDMEKLAEEVIGGDNKSGKTYKLIKNIDLGGKFDSDGNPLEGNNPWTPIGSGTKPFSGTFDGAGHIITGMYIDSTKNAAGLFRVVSGGTIKNLGIEDSYVKSSLEYSGVFAGQIVSDSSVLNCYNGGTVSGQKFTGGIIGTANNSTIKNSYNFGSVISDYKQFAGGIVSYGSSSLIENCYNSGSILYGYEIGGIAGGGALQIRNTYNVGNVNSSNYNVRGGIIGQLYVDGIVQNSYNSGDLGSSYKGGIVGNIYQNKNQQLINNYYLNTTASYGIFRSTNDSFESYSDNGTAPLSAGEMPSVISVINGDDAFVPDTKGINNGYPILSWQQ